MRVQCVVVLLLFGGCLGSCETRGREAEFQRDVAPLVGEYGAIDPSTLPRGELAVAKGRKALVIDDGKVLSGHMGYVSLLGWDMFAKTHAEVGLATEGRVAS